MAHLRRYRVPLIPMGTIVALVLASCSLKTAPDVETAQGRPIVGGSPDTNPAHMAVVALTFGPGSSSFCTGTLVTQTVVVTAAHCVDTTPATSIQAFFGNDVWQGGDYRPVSEKLVHPGYTASNENDIALLRLQSNAPANVTPIPHLPASLALTAADEGSSLEFSGFGVTEFNTSGEKLHVAGIVLGRVCPGPSGCSYSGAWVVPAGIGYPQTPGGPCSGDSGGPAFMLRQNVEYLVGVTSYGDPGCSQYGVSTMVDPFASWIDGFIGSGGTEDCATPGDEDGDGLADCNDPDCATFPACAGPDACEAAQAVGCGDTIADSTVGGPTYFTGYSCLTQSTEDGPERAYQLTMPVGTSVTANLTIGAGTGDLDLFLVPGSGGSCNTFSCIDSSLNSGNTAESITFNVPSGGAYLVVDTWEANQPGPFTLQISCQGNVEDCDNGTDDDGDGAVDCTDTDCTAHPSCQPPNPEICGNNLDDDGDGAIDCGDSDCVNFPDCQIPGQEQCVNGIDDDGDGAIDCDDSDCASNPACQPGNDGGVIIPGFDAGEDSPTPVTGGCGCHESPEHGLPGFLFLLLVVGFLLFRRLRPR